MWEKSKTVENLMPYSTKTGSCRDMCKKVQVDSRKLAMSTFQVLIDNFLMRCSIEGTKSMFHR